MSAIVSVLLLLTYVVWVVGYLRTGTPPAAAEAHAGGGLPDLAGHERRRGDAVRGAPP